MQKYYIVIIILFFLAVEYALIISWYDIIKVTSVKCVILDDGVACNDPAYEDLGRDFEVRFYQKDYKLIRKDVEVFEPYPAFFPRKVMEK